MCNSVISRCSNPSRKTEEDLVRKNPEMRMNKNYQFPNTNCSGILLKLDRKTAVSSEVKQFYGECDVAKNTCTAIVAISEAAKAIYVAYRGSTLKQVVCFKIMTKKEYCKCKRILISWGKLG